MVKKVGYFYHYSCNESLLARREDWTSLPRQFIIFNYEFFNISMNFTVLSEIKKSQAFWLENRMCETFVIILDSKLTQLDSL